MTSLNDEFLLCILRLLRRLLETLDSLNLIVLKRIEKYLFRIKTVTVSLEKSQWTLNNYSKMFTLFVRITPGACNPKMPLFFWSVLLRERLIYL